MSFSIVGAKAFPRWRVMIFASRLCSNQSGRIITPKYKPSDLEKVLLVWTKKFKSRAEIPQFVSPDLIERTRSEARIKIANVLMLLTALTSFGFILSGKAAAKRGESVHQHNLDWHKKYNEDYEKKEAAKKQ